MTLSPGDGAVTDARRARVTALLARSGARVVAELPDGTPLAAAGGPAHARVAFRDAAGVRALAAGDHLALVEAFLAGRIDVEGELAEVVKVAEHLDLEPGVLARLAWLLRLRLPRRRWGAAAIAFHYDRPPEFFLPWFERWRSYSHGFYTSPDEDPSVAQARKLQCAVDRLGLQPGMHVLDMGAGWGSFVEYAGLRGIHVHGITLSAAQRTFVQALIDARGLPCSVELVDFLAYRPARRFDAAVFMGTLEHVPDYDHVAAFLARHLVPEGRVWADFCAHRSARMFGAFIRRHIWPGPTSYVDLGRLVRALTRGGFNVHEVGDDTASYAYTVRDWARGLERCRDTLAARFGEPSVRAFLVMLWASHHFFATNQTQAYHLVAGRRPRA